MSTRTFPAPVLPSPAIAAIAIRAVGDALYFADPSLSEPARAAAVALGWGEQDGSEWWHAAMDELG